MSTKATLISSEISSPTYTLSDLQENKGMGIFSIEKQHTGQTLTVKLRQDKLTGKTQWKGLPLELEQTI